MGTEAVQVEERLRESEQLYRSLVEGIADYAIYKIDAQGYVRTWSPGAVHLSGYSPEEVLGRHLSCLYSPEDVQNGRVDEELRLANALGKFESEGWRLRKDGSRFWGCVLVTPLRDSAGKLIGYSRVMQDVTERRSAEQKLRQSEDRFRTLVESMPGLVFATNAAGRTTFVNNQFLTYTGLSLEEAIGCVWVNLMHPEDRELITAQWASRGDNVTAYEGEFRLRRQKGDWRWQMGRAVPLRDAAGTVIEWLGTALDIDDRKRANERVEALVEQRTAELTVAMKQAEHALDEKTVLLKEVHHRVKNNLAVVMGLLGMQAAASDAAASEVLKESQRRVQSMALIHEHLYATGKLSAIDFAEYSRQLAVELLAMYGMTERVTVHMETDPVELPLHRAIPCGLILNELISNAFKYAFPDNQPGNITVGFRKQADGGALMWVENDGESFAGGVDWKNSKSVGLKIVSILIRQLDGSMSLRANPGTRVEILLPR